MVPQPSFLQDLYQLFGKRATHVTTDSSIKMPESERRKAEAMVRHGEQARTLGARYASAIAREVRLSQPEQSVKVGNIKQLQRIWDKAVEKYDGDVSKVGDVSRERILVDSAEDVLRIRSLFGAGRGGKFHDEWAGRGVKVIEVDDYFANPSPTGFLGINVKLEVDIGRGRTARNELQIVHREMIPTLDTTHGYYEVKRKLIEHAKTRGPEFVMAHQDKFDGSTGEKGDKYAFLTKDEKAVVLRIDDMAKDMHEKDGLRLGLVSLRSHKGPHAVETSARSAPVYRPAANF